MQYVYARSNGIFEIRYPVPDDVQKYFPKPNGDGWRDTIVQSLGTRDQHEANRFAAAKMRDLDRRFAVLRLGVIEPEFDALCRRIFEFEMREAERRRLELVEQELRDEVRIAEEKDRPNRIRNLNIEIFAYRDALKDQSREALEASVGWIVDHYDATREATDAAIHHDPDRRFKLLEIAASVMRDVLTHQSYAAHGITQMPPLTAAPLLVPAAAEVSPGDAVPYTNEGRFTLAKYWDVYEKAQQGSSSPVVEGTLRKRKIAWKELQEVLGGDTPLFKVKKTDIWNYRDALTQAPARGGSTSALRDLSLPQRIKVMKAEPKKYRSLDPDTIGDRLRHINSVFKLAVDRGHIDRNPALGVSESKPAVEQARDAYNVNELQRIFSASPFDRPCPLHLQTDEFWVPLLALFLGARSSEMYIRTADIVLEGEVPHLRLVEFEERSLKNAASSRLLPIHPQLVELGFLAYCKHAKENWDELFPTWEFRDNQRPSDGPGRRRFNRHLKKLFPDRTHPADLHTFRHTFETALRQLSDVSDDVKQRLSGRTVGSSAARYIHDVGFLRSLAKAVGQIRYEGLRLDHLRT